MKRFNAILLAGPTGSGKTPFGNFMDNRKFRGRRCIHFDFGENLRRVAEKGTPGNRLTREDVDVVVRALKSGALLEDENFHIAENILLSFLRRRKAGEGDLVILNGLPRHIGQAAGMDRIADVKLVVLLECGPGVISERLRLDSGGDRAGRKDDSPAAMACKLRIFEKRTIPLINHYERKDVEILKVKITARTTTEEILQSLEKCKIM